jgi:hypothetical protein
MERVNVRRLPDAWGADDEALLQAIDDATATPVYIAYAFAPEWFDGVQAMIDELEAVVPARPAVAVALIEHAILRLDRAAGAVDDSDGGLVEAFERLEPLHAAAAMAAHVDPGALARRVVELADGLDVEPFVDAARTHRDALGRAGLEAIIPAAELRRAAGPGGAALDHLIANARSALAEDG